MCKMRLDEFDEPYDEGSIAGVNRKLFEMVEILDFYGVEPIQRAKEFESNNEGFELLPSEADRINETMDVTVNPRIVGGEFRVFELK